jgi:inosine-uridine nucleoside N-ribohydrolase
VAALHPRQDFGEIESGQFRDKLVVACYLYSEVRQMRGISADVQKTYTSLLTTLQDLAAAGNVRVIGSAMHNADPPRFAQVVSEWAKKLPA